MWSYEKRLQFPVRIQHPNAAAAKVIISQYGGPYGGGLRKRGAPGPGGPSSCGKNEASPRNSSFR